LTPTLESEEFPFHNQVREGVWIGLIPESEIFSKLRYCIRMCRHYFVEGGEGVEVAIGRNPYAIGFIPCNEEHVHVIKVGKSPLRIVREVSMNHYDLTLTWWKRSDEGPDVVLPNIIEQGGEVVAELHVVEEPLLAVDLIEASAVNVDLIVRIHAIEEIRSGVIVREDISAYPSIFEYLDRALGKFSRIDA
jgi:hypothetical protein